MLSLKYFRYECRRYFYISVPVLENVIICMPVSSFLLAMQDSRTLYMKRAFWFFFVWFGLSSFFAKINRNSFKNYEGIYANLCFQNVPLQYSKPNFHSMVQVNHRCILLEVAPRTYDELRYDSNDSDRSFLHFSHITQSLLNKT